MSFLLAYFFGAVDFQDQCPDTQGIFQEEMECMPRTTRRPLPGQRGPLATGDLWQCINSVGYIL